MERRPFTAPSGLRNGVDEGADVTVPLHSTPCIGSNQSGTLV